MGSPYVFAVALALMVLMSGSALASEAQVDVTVTPAAVRTDLQVPAVFLVSIRNNQDYQERLKVMVSGPYIHWATNPVILLVVPARSGREFNLTFYPVEHRGDFIFSVDVASYINPEINESRAIAINIPPAIAVKGFSAARSGSQVTVLLDVETISQRRLDMDFKVVDGSGRTISSAQSGQDVKGVQSITKVLDIPENALAGEYKAAYAINGELNGEQTFTVEPVRKIEREEERTENLMYADVVVRYTNLGNVVEKDYAVEQTIPADKITGFITQPESCSEGAGSKQCEYVISKLEPGETAMISYRVEYWPLYVQIFSAAIIVAIAAGFVFIRATSPTIRKTSVSKGANVHSIILEIKNPFMHHIKDVVVRDWVSPVANFMHEEVAALKPVVKKSEAGTELIWKLGDIRPKEVRILTYKVRTVFDGVALTMPRAYARFLTPRGRRSKIYSKPLSS